MLGKTIVIAGEGRRMHLHVRVHQGSFKVVNFHLTVHVQNVLTTRKNKQTLQLPKATSPCLSENILLEED